MVQTGDRLTATELLVLACRARGMTNASTGRQMRLAEETVKNHLRRAYCKLGADNAPQAVAHAYEAGLLPLPVEVIPRVIKALTDRYVAATGRQPVDL